MNRKFLLLLAVLFFCAFSVYARGSSDKNSASVNIVRVTGIVRLVGSSVFPELVISGTYLNGGAASSGAASSGAEMQWYIAANERDKLHSLQHRTVTVEGEETAEEMRFASGMFAGIRRELKNIRIISTD
jgi:hypothetical protein